MSLVSKTSSLSAHLLLAAAFTMPSGSVAAKELFDRMSVQDNLPMGAFVREMISNKGWSARRQWRVMMIRDILVTLPTGDATSIALDDAITVAGNFDAHLTGVAFVPDLTSAANCSRRLPCWIMIAKKWTPPLKPQSSGSKKRGNEKASALNGWFSPHRDRAP